jgi:hypothetical protein
MAYKSNHPPDIQVKQNPTPSVFLPDKRKPFSIFGNRNHSVFETTLNL